jgi:hypothetical protein
MIRIDASGAGASAHFRISSAGDPSTAAAWIKNLVQNSSTDASIPRVRGIAMVFLFARTPYVVAQVSGSSSSSSSSSYGGDF